MAAQESMKYVSSRRGWFLIVSAGLLLAGALAAPADLPAQTPLHERTALKYIPDDAAFYTSSLRLRQQFETVIASKAFARLRELPSIKSAVEEFQKGWAAESSAAAPTAPVKEKNPERAGKEKNEDDDGDEDDPDAAAADADWSEAIRSLKEFWNDRENQKLVGVGLDAVSHEIFF